MKNNKLTLTPKYSKIKSLFESQTNGSPEYGTNFEINGELDNLCYEFIDLLSIYTLEQGYGCIIEGVKMDLWKERIWTIVEKAGLLPPIAWKEELEILRLEELENEPDFIEDEQGVEEYLLYVKEDEEELETEE